MVTAKDRRSEERIECALTIRLGNACGVTRDVSASGTNILLNSDIEIGKEVCFEIEMEGFNQKLLVKCKGTPTRTVHIGKQISIAVAITESIIKIST